MREKLEVIVRLINSAHADLKRLRAIQSPEQADYTIEDVEVGLQMTLKKLYALGEKKPAIHSLQA